VARVKVMTAALMMMPSGSWRPEPSDLSQEITREDSEEWGNRSELLTTAGSERI